MTGEDGERVLAVGLAGGIEAVVRDVVADRDGALAVASPAAIDAGRDGALPVASRASADADPVAGAACVVVGHERGRVDGLEVLDAVAGAAGSPPVVFVPTDPEPSVATAAVERDVDAYLPAATVVDDPGALADAVADATADRASSPVPSPDGGLAADAGVDAAGAFDLEPGVPEPLADVEREPDAFERLVELAPDATFLADADTGAILYANPAAADVLGYDAATFTGVHVTELHPGDPDALMAKVAGVLDDDAVAERRFDAVSDIELLTADGETVPVAMRVDAVDLDGRTVVAAVFRDVADRRARIEELERTERRLRNVTEAAFDIVFRLDDAGQFRTVSGTVESVLGYDPAALEGASFGAVVADEHVERAMDAFAATRDGERHEELELRLVTADGRRRIAEVNVIPVVVDGEFRGIEGAARDVTRQVRRERLLSVLNRVLRHNVRNAATVLLGHVDALDGPPTDAAPDHVDEIRATAEDLVTLGEKSTRLRRAARNQDAAASVDAVTATERAVAHADADVAVRADGVDDATVNVGGELEFVVRELVANATQHAGGVAAVSVGRTDGTVVIAVTDDGDGLPRQERLVLEGGDESALEHGSGLGLWLVNWIATAGGGRVAVDTGADGTTVEVRLPARTA